MIYSHINSIRKRLVDSKQLQDKWGRVISFKNDAFDFGVYGKNYIKITMQDWFPVNINNK